MPREGETWSIGRQPRFLAAIVLLILLNSSAADNEGVLLTGTANQKEIYGADNRIDVYQETDPQRQASASAVCALISTNILTDAGDGTYVLDTAAATADYLPLCEDDPFSGQPIAAMCTGFMVGEDLITTAGHCVLEGLFDCLIDFRRIRVVFGFEMLDPATPVTVFTQDQVYSVSEIIAAELNWFNDRDFAVLRLDRPITAPGAEPLPLRDNGRVQIGEKVGVIGHPLGLPLKLAFGADTQVYAAPQDYSGTGDIVFFTNFDACAGNSGSPVFNQETGVVEGVYTFSYVPDTIQYEDCFSVNQVPNSRAAQGVVMTTAFVDYVNAANQGARGMPVGGCCGGLLKTPPADALSADAFGDVAAMLAAAALLAGRGRHA